MKFFIPGIEDSSKGQELYEIIKKFAKETTGWDIKDHKIYYIKWRHDRADCEAKVGELQIRQNETVMAILESTVTFLVCTSNRGVLRGMPLLVGREEVITIEDFEE